MSETLQSSYDDLPYASKFFTMTHPDRMATMARLHGMTPPPVATCRVLELGCSNGGNLLPMAQTLPDARFVGIDFSPRQIADGQELLDTLQFHNVDLKALSILDINDDFGKFDYIICHGVYSWVPAEVSAKILSICARNLAPNGVAYVSYNVYPGWHLRGMVREMLLYHTRVFAEPLTRVRQARALLDFLVHAAPHPQGSYANILKSEARLLEAESDTYLFHEHLEQENHPVYFHDFVARASAVGLQYLAPARFQSLDAHVKPEARALLDQLGDDRVRREQYLDFVRNRTFRQSLLCHAGVAIQDAPRAEVVPELWMTALARPLSETPDVHSEAPEEFESLTGERATTGRPLLKAAIVGLYDRWHRFSSFDDVRDDVQARLGLDEIDPETLAAGLLQAHMTNLVAFHGVEARCIADEPGEKPKASPVARIQAERGMPIVSLRLRYIALEEFDLLVLRLLDGTRDRPALVAALLDLVADGTFAVHQGEGKIADPSQIQAALTAALEPSLRRIAELSLLLDVS